MCAGRPTAITSPRICCFLSCVLSMLVCAFLLFLHLCAFLCSCALMCVRALVLFVSSNYFHQLFMLTTEDCLILLCTQVPRTRCDLVGRSRIQASLSVPSPRREGTYIHLHAFKQSRWLNSFGDMIIIHTLARALHYSHARSFSLQSIRIGLCVRFQKREAPLFLSV